MAGVVQNAVVRNDEDFAVKELGGPSIVEELKLSYNELDQRFDDADNGYNELKHRNVEKKRDPSDKGSEPTAVESWCVIWYLGAFGCLVCFFLVITCTELFFGNPLYRTDNLNSFVQNIIGNEHKSYVPETPPPPYHLFAPPDYNETIQKIVTEKRKSLDVFVVPVHVHGHSSGRPAAAVAALPAFPAVPAVPAPPPYEHVVDSKMVMGDKFTVVSVYAGASGAVA